MIIILKVTALICDNKGKVLLIKEWSKKKNGYFWNVVKGTFTPPQDKNLAETVIREAKEEINLDVDVENILSIFEINKADSFLLQVNFICRPKTGSRPSLPKLFEKNEEIVEFKWFNFYEFRLIKEDEFMGKRVVVIVNDFFRTS